MAENLSGIPPLVTLSGLDAGPGGFSGATQQSLGGTGGYGTAIPGMEGGLDLAQLLQLFSGMGGGTAESGGVGTSMPLGGGFGGLGQDVGGLGAGSFSQGLGAGAVTPQEAPQNYVAGQSGAQPVSGAGAGSADPLAVIQKILGLAQKGASLLPTVGAASPTVGDAGTSMSDQLRSQTPVASPTIPAESPGGIGGLSGPLFAGTASPQPFGFNQGLSLSDQLRSGVTNQNLEFTQQAAPGQFGAFSPEYAQAVDALFQAGYTGPQIQEILGGMEQATANLAGPGAAIGTGFSQADAGAGSLSGAVASPTASSAGSPGVDLGGVAGGGLGAAGSLLALIEAIQSGNYERIPQSALGLYQGAAGVSGGLGSDLIPQITGGSGAMGLAALINALPGLLGAERSPHDPVGPAGTTVPIADTIRGLAAANMATAATATGAIPYAAIIAQALQDAYSIYKVASGEQDVKSAALGSIPLIGPYVQGLEHQLDTDPGSWATIGKAATQMGEGALGTGQRANELFSQFQQSGQQNDPLSLLSALQYGSNALFPFYNTVTGPAGPVGPGDWAGRAGNPAGPQYSAVQQQLLSNVFNTIPALQAAGLQGPDLLAAISQLQANPRWGEPNLGGMAAPVAPQLPGLTPQPGQAAFGETPGYEAIAAGSWLSPQATNTALGGPVGSMLAALNPELYAGIGGQPQYSDPAVQEEILRMQQYADLINAQALQDFTSGGG